MSPTLCAGTHPFIQSTSISMDHGQWTMVLIFHRGRATNIARQGDDRVRSWGGGEVTENTNTKTKIRKYKNTNSKRYGDDRWGGGSNHWQLRPIHRGGIPTLLPSIPTLLPQQFFILNFNHVYDALHRHVETSLSVVLIRTQYQLCNILAPYLFRLILLKLISFANDLWAIIVWCSGAPIGQVLPLQRGTDNWQRSLPLHDVLC